MTARILVVVALLGVASEAAADVIYTYVGASFVDIEDSTLPPGTFDTSMRVTGEFVLADALAPGLASTDISGLIKSFSFSSGRDTLTDLDPINVVLFSVSTDALGAISAWGISIQRLDAVNGGQDVIVQTVNDSDLGLPVEDRGQLEVCDPVFLPRGLCVTMADVGSVGDAPGKWTATDPGTGAVPEPATLTLCSLGLWAARRRLRPAARR